MLSDTLLVLTQVAMLVFVVGSMAAMGLGLTVARIAQPLRDVRLVLALLVVNFVVVPAAAIAAARLLPMEEAAATAVVLIGCVAGAPFLSKLAQLSKSNIATAVGIMVMLMLVTIAFAPIVVPLAVPGATVDPWEIAQSLVLFMLIPLGLGLFVRARYPELADEWVGDGREGVEHWAAARHRQRALPDLARRHRIDRDVALPGPRDHPRDGARRGLARWPGRPSGDRVSSGSPTANRNIAAALVIASTDRRGRRRRHARRGARRIPVLLIVLAGQLGRRAAIARHGRGAPRPAEPDRGRPQVRALEPARRGQQQVDHLGRPARLVHREAGPRVPVEVLGERQQVPPRRVGLQVAHLPVDGAPAVRAGEPDRDVAVSPRSSAISARVRRRPDPVGYSTVNSSPRNR